VCLREKGRSDKVDLFYMENTKASSITVRERDMIWSSKEVLSFRPCPVGTPVSRETTTTEYEGRRNTTYNGMTCE